MYLLSLNIPGGKNGVCEKIPATPDIIPHLLLFKLSDVSHCIITHSPESLPSGVQYT